MDVLDAIKDRRSVRSFLPKDVSKQTIQEIFSIARWAPSGVNHQPWKVAALSLDIRQHIAADIIHARENQTPENPDYQYYPQTWEEPYKTRRKVCGKALYGALGIGVEDTDARKEAWYKNYHFFHAPAGLIFYLESKLAKGSWLDMGMFIQSAMLAARGMGLETCAQASLAEFPDIVRQYTNITDEHDIVCGMALGYADWDAPVNNYRTEREPADSFVQFIE